MLINLLSNAVKFTPPGGTVTVRYPAWHPVKAGEQAIGITDTGLGIDPAFHAEVLEPFGQVHDPLTRSTGGTGLGLPIVRSLIEMHGGRLVLESALGAGTTVTLIFPAPGLGRSQPIE
jgi:signal transduction histidine kinase